MHIKYEIYDTTISDIFLVHVKILHEITKSGLNVNVL